MTGAVEVRLDEFTLLANRRKGGIPAELAAFIVLQVCDAAAGGAVAPEPAHVRLSTDGSVRVEGAPAAASETASTEAMGRLLSALLAGPSARSATVLAPQLDKVRRRASGPDVPFVDRAEMCAEIERAISPLKPDAARRVLGRFVRDALSANTPSVPTRLPFDRHADVDRELDEMFARETSRTRPGGPSFFEGDGQKSAPPVAPGARSKSPPRAQSGSSGPTGPNVSAPRSVTESAILESLDLAEAEPRKGGVSAGLFFATVVLLVGMLLGLLYAFKPEFFQGPSHWGEEARRRAHDAAMREKARLEAAASHYQYGRLTVRSAPEGAAVLLFAGRAPVEIPNLEVGVPQVLYAEAPGRPIARVVVPPDARWVAGPGAPGAERRLVLTVEVPPGTGPPDRFPLDLPEPLAGEHPRGRLSVRSEPAGARIYLLVGYTPTEPIVDLRIDRPYDLRVVKDGHRVERVLIGPSDWQPAGMGEFQFDASVTLRRR